MSSGRFGRDRRGMTLIELVLTLTIVAMAAGLVSGALATALRAWQSGLRSGREELVARIVLERLATQLRAAIRTPARRDNADAVAFDVGGDHLRFVTLAGGAAPTQVFYGLQEDAVGRHLVYRELPWPDKDFFSDSRPRAEEQVVEVTGFSAKAVKRSEEANGGAGATGTTRTDRATGAIVAAEWSPLDEELPERIELEIQVHAEGEAQARTYAVSVPVLAQGEKP